MLDVVVIGGGPAGLQAALTLARGQRRVALVDGGPPRNTRAHRVHTFVTRDGVPPSEFRALARRELTGYGVELVEGLVTTVSGDPGNLTVQLDARSLTTRRVLLALGVRDLLPALDGLEPLWGDTIFQCPYCHGHELRGRRWSALLAGPEQLEAAMICRPWSSDVVAFTHGWSVTDDQRAKLARAGIAVEEAPVRRLHPDPAAPDRLGAVELSDGRTLERDAMLLRPLQRPALLVESLGLRLAEGSVQVAVDTHQQTSRPGIYAAGDMSGPMQAAISAAASGMFAAGMLNHQLTAEDLGWSRDRLGPGTRRRWLPPPALGSLRRVVGLVRQLLRRAVEARHRTFRARPPASVRARG